MKSVYERAKLIITEFDTEDVIVTSGQVITPSELDYDNYYHAVENFDIAPPGNWF